jgi:hypothetical protein
MTFVTVSSIPPINCGQGARLAAFNARPLRGEIAIELLRSLAVLESQLVQLSTFRIHPCNLLEARVVICSYNDHLRLLSPEPFGWCAPQSLLESGSRHCYGINYSDDPSSEFGEISVGT